MEVKLGHIGKHVKVKKKRKEIYENCRLFTVVL
jgi:hypothetical protein